MHSKNWILENNQNENFYFQGNVNKTAKAQKLITSFLVVFTSDVDTTEANLFGKQGISQSLKLRISSNIIKQTMVIKDIKI